MLGDRALLVLPPVWSVRGNMFIFTPSLEGPKGVCTRRHCAGNFPVELGCMEPLLLPWVPECEQECHLFIPHHVPGPAIELVSAQINCPINTCLFIQQVN